jgi:peptidoglycan/LPS O-acetylase OafA/YrhL
VLLVFAFIGVANTFMVSGNFKSILENIFIARYIGHFLCGIILYELFTKRTVDGLSSTLLLIGVFLVGISIHRHNAWIEGLGKGGIYSIQNNRITLVSVCIFLIVYVVVESSKIIKSKKMSRFMVFLGSISYPFYLLHADLSFYSHAMFERNIFGIGVYSSGFTTEEMISVALIASVVLSSIVCIYLEPIVRTMLVKFIDGVIQFSSKVIDGSLVK